MQNPQQSTPPSQAQPTQYSSEKTPPGKPESTLTASRRLIEIEELDAAIGRLNRLINSTNYELMVLIREFDERAGWLKWGFTDGLNWLRWRCDISTNAARDKLRIAHALKQLPEISKAFSSGKLSYTKVRALTRVATLDTELELIDMSRNMTARHVEEHCKQRCNAKQSSTSGALRAQQSTHYRVWHDENRGTAHLSIELPLDEAQLIEKAIEKAAVSLSSDTGSVAAMPDETVSWANLQVAALVTVCKTYLSNSYLPGSSTDKPDQEGSNATSTADNYQVVVHIDESALAGNETGASQLPVESVRRLCCDGSMIPLVESEAGEPLSIGRKVRTVTTAIKRALWARDKGCGFPGCSHTRFVDAHHIKHWADGGETSVENLILLCSSHHKLVHEGGYSIHRDSAGVLFFRRPDGKAVPHCGYRIDDVLDDESDLSDRENESIKKHESFRYDLTGSGWHSFSGSNRVSENSREFFVDTEDGVNWFDLKPNNPPVSGLFVG